MTTVRTFGLTLLAALVLVLGVSTSATAATGPGSRGVSVSAWLPFWEADALAVVRRHEGLFGAVSPFWYEAGATRIHAYPGAGSRTYVRALRRAGADVVPTVTSRLTPGAMAALGRSRPARARHVRALVRLAVRGGFDGLDLDYEHMALTTSPAQARRAREGFTALVRELCPRLRRTGRTCVVTVMPRTHAAPYVWRHKLIPAVYDYAKLGRAVDRLRVMTYDQHAPNTGPGPMGSIVWTEQVMRFAMTQTAARKLELGIPLYGRDWGGGRVGTLTWPQAESLRRRVGARRRWDRRTASPWFRYRSGGRRHVVWYSDASSSVARVQLAERLGIAGVAFWALGQGDPHTWRRLRRTQGSDGGVTTVR